MAVRLRRRGWERTTLVNIPNVPTDQWRNRPFVGRNTEYRVLYEMWEAVRQGSARHALILGDSGIGKTTLVQRLTTAAGLEGAAISRVQCYDVEREIPYSTLSGLVIGLLGCPGVSAASPEALAELSRTVPQVRQKFANIPDPRGSHGEAARLRLTEAFLEMLIVISEEHPVVLVIDDLHLTDDVSLAVLHLIMRRCQKHPVMVVLVARPGELTPTSQAVRLRRNGSSLGVREINLAPLSKEESRALLISLVQQEPALPTPAEERALLRASAGFPMVLELLVQDWKVSPAASLALGLDAMTTQMGGIQSAGSAYSKILDRISSSVDGTTNNVLNLAAILGRRLSDLDMYGIVDLSTGQTMTAMAELVERRVLRDGAQGLEFVNELLRAAVYLAVPQTLRRVLHGNIADRFLQQHERGQRNINLEIAWHCMRAGRTVEATNHLLQGARDSVSTGSLHEAERALSTAIPHLQDKERGDATLLLVEVLQEQGRWQESLGVLRDTALQHSTEAYLVYSIGATYWSEGCSFEESRSHLSVLLSIIDSDFEPRLRVKAAKISATLVSGLRDAHMARLLLQSIAKIPAGTDTDDLARLTDCKAQLLYHALEPALCLQEITRVATQLNNEQLVNSTVASLHNGLGVLQCGEGRYLDGKAEFRRAYDISISLGNDTVGGSRAAQIALCCVRLGEYEEALEWSIAAERIVGQRPVGGYLDCEIARHKALSHALLGDAERALQTIASFEVRLPQSAPAWIHQGWGLHKADILFYGGMKTEAFAAAGLAIGDSNEPVLYDPGFAGSFARWIGMMGRVTRCEESARSHIEPLARSLNRYDALDQVEILCAMLLTHGATEEGRDELVRRMNECLDRLPWAIRDQLSFLGVLPDVNGRTSNPALAGMRKL